MRQKKGRAFWKKVARAYERSGLEQRVFCEQQGVALSSFQHWLYKLRREEKTSNQDSTALVRVRVLQSATDTRALEAGLPSGVVLRFSVDTDPRYVATLLAEVEKARC